MPTPITHGLVGVALAQVAPAGTPRWKSAMLLAFIAAMPDLDMVLHYRGVAYSSQLGHRGLSHSFFFAACVAIVFGAFMFRRVDPKRAPLRRAGVHSSLVPRPARCRNRRRSGCRASHPVC